MTVPHYINGDRSEMRGIKPGWYAMNDASKLKSGPFSSHEECLSRSTSLHMNRYHLSRVHDLVETIDTRSASRAAPAEVQPGTAP